MITPSSKHTTCAPLFRRKCRAWGPNSWRSRLTLKKERAATREQSEEFLNRQRDGLDGCIAANDVVITTASVPGRRAPRLLTASMVAGMRRGSVIVDMAAESGGNCELTRPGQVVEVDGIWIDGTLFGDAKESLVKLVSAVKAA